METRANPNPSGCLSRALPDEPLFVLLARDRCAPDTIRFWSDRRAQIAVEQAGHQDAEQLSEALETADTMERWREANDGAWRNPDRAVLIGGHQAAQVIACRILARRPADEVHVHGSKFDTLLNEAKALAEFLLAAAGCEGTLQRGRRDEASIEDRVATLETQMEKVMADVDTLSATLDAIANDVSLVAAKQSEQLAEIQQLQAQVAAGQPVDLSGLVTRAENIKTTLDNIAGAASTGDSSTGSTDTGSTDGSAGGDQTTGTDTGSTDGSTAASGSADTGDGSAGDALTGNADTGDASAPTS